MKQPSLPALEDIQSVVVDYLDAVAPTVSASIARTKAIANSISPFAMLITACDIAYANGPLEAAIWDAFMQDVVRAHLRHANTQATALDSNARHEHHNRKYTGTNTTH